MKVWKYVGPADAIDLEGVGTVEQGQTIEVEDPAISDGLDGQADWEHLPVSRETGEPHSANAETEKDA